MPLSTESREVDQLLREGLSALIAESIVRDIDRDTPELLSVVRERDAVHPVRDEADLARRLSADRLICALVHPARPDAALAFVEIAFVRAPLVRVENILDPDSPVLDVSTANLGVFYGISNTEPGAAGLAVGGLLIEGVLGRLPARFPQIRNWVTMSPIPGLRKWLSAHPDRAGLSELDAAAARELRSKPELARLTRTFLTEEVDRNGRTVDPVARFHLGNGAVLGDVLLEANNSERADAESLGVMASYVYVRDGERV